MRRPWDRAGYAFEGRVDEDYAVTAFDSETEQVRASAEDFGVGRQARVGGECFGDAAADPVGAHQGIAEADDEGGAFHAATSGTEVPCGLKSVPLGATGMRIVNVLPLPTSLWTEMVPRCVVTMP